MERFWEKLSLQQMSKAQWEALCDGCGKCCLVKLEDTEGAMAYTDLACRLLDCENARCRDYANRAQRVADCVVLTPENLSDVYFMPKSCAYRRLAEGRGLADWHPLISGRAESVAEAGHSVAGHVVSETAINEPPELRIIDWIDKKMTKFEKKLIILFLQSVGK